MRTLAILFVLALALVFTSAATADPSGPNVQDNLTFTCDGQQVVMNGGTLTNRSHQVFVVGAPYIFVAQSAVVLTPDGETIVFFDTAPGIQGAITCVATANGFTLTVRRVLHSRHVRTSGEGGRARRSPSSPFYNRGGIVA